MAKRIVVLLDELLLRAYQNDEIVHEFSIVPGDEDHPTPEGCFSVRSKHREYTSRKYNVPMNYAMFFTNTGEAIHQYHGPVGIPLLRWLRGNVSDWFGSHGCVRLSEEDARELFEWTPMGTPVIVGRTGQMPACSTRRRRQRGRPGRGRQPSAQ